MIISEVDGHIEKNRNKHLMLDSTNKNKKIVQKYIGLLNRIKNEIETINECQKGEYNTNFMKIKFDTDDNLQLNKILKFHNMTRITRSFSWRRW